MRFLFESFIFVQMCGSYVTGASAPRRLPLCYRWRWRLIVTVTSCFDAYCIISLQEKDGSCQSILPSILLDFIIGHVRDLFKEALPASAVMKLITVRWVWMMWSWPVLRPFPASDTGTEARYGLWWSFTQNSAFSLLTTRRNPNGVDWWFR
jgi:hypothetical protein